MINKIQEIKNNYKYSKLLKKLKKNYKTIEYLNEDNLISITEDLLCFKYERNFGPTLRDSRDGKVIYKYNLIDKINDYPEFTRKDFFQFFDDEESKKNFKYIIKEINPKINNFVKNFSAKEREKLLNIKEKIKFKAWFNPFRSRNCQFLKYKNPDILLEFPEIAIDLIIFVSIINASLQFNFWITPFKEGMHNSNTIHDIIERSMENIVFKELEKFKDKSSIDNLKLELLKEIRKNLLKITNSFFLKKINDRINIIDYFIQNDPDSVNFNAPTFKRDPLLKKMFFSHYLILESLKFYINEMRLYYNKKNQERSFPEFYSSIANAELSLLPAIDYRIPQAINQLNLFPEKDYSFKDR